MNYTRNDIIAPAWLWDFCTEEDSIFGDPFSTDQWTVAYRRGIFVTIPRLPSVPDWVNGHSGAGQRIAAWLNAQPVPAERWRLDLLHIKDVDLGIGWCDVLGLPVSRDLLMHCAQIPGVTFWRSSGTLPQDFHAVGLTTDVILFARDEVRGVLMPLKNDFQARHKSGPVAATWSIHTDVKGGVK